MAKRRESLFDILLIVPWWVSAVLACIAYVVLAFWIPASSEDSTSGSSVALASRTYALPLAGLFLLVGAASFTRSLFLRRKFDALDGINEIRQLSWRQFESIVGEAFRRRGYTVMENAVDGPDGGVDLVLRKDGAKFYVQCKQWKQAKVGVKPIRELYGVISAGGAAGGFFVVSGDYTREAREFAVQCGIELIDGPMLSKMIEEAKAPEPFMDPTQRKRAVTMPIPVSDPDCPQCGGTMVLRTAKRGPQAGADFWGCQAYPQCRGTRAV
jgi:restriction system protein